MYAGDELYGDDITSPLVQPAPPLPFDVPTCQNVHCTRVGLPMRESETGWFCSGKDGRFFCNETG